MSASFETLVRGIGAPRSDDLLEALLSAAGDRTALLDPTGTIVAVNQAWMQFGLAHGARSDSIGVGTNYLDTCRGQEDGCGAAALSGIESVLKGRTARFSCEYACSAYGMTWWFHLTTSAVRGGYAIVAHADITQAKVEEAKIKESEDRFRALTELSADWYWEQDAELRFNYISPGLEERTRIRAETLLGKRRWEVKEVEPRTDADRLTLDRATSRHEPYRDILVTRRCDGGNLLVLSLSGTPIFDAQGRFMGYRGIVRNVTGQMRAEEALRASESKFRAVFDSDVIPITIWNADGRIVDANDAYLRLTGFTRAELEAGQCRWDAITSPGQLHLDRAAVEEIRRRGACTPFEKDYVLRDGRRVPVLIAGAVLPGMTDEGIGFAIDLTERKRAESALRASEELYRILMANFPRGAVAVLDERLRFEVVDGEWLAATGQHKEAMIGATVAEAVSPELAREFEPHLSAALKGRPHSFELTCRGRTSEVHVAPLPSPRGLKVMAVVQDVTERVAAQRESTEHRAALSRSQKRIRALAARLLTGQEEERRRIARELHDDINQRIAVLAVALGAIRDRAREAKPDLAADLGLLYQKTVAISDDVRRLTRNLHCELLEHVGLAAALRGLIDELSEQTGMQVELCVEEPLGTIPRAVALCLYRVAQEALRNVLQHAGATDARVTLARTSSVLELKVTDRGRGFERDALRFAGGLGLVSMEERVRLVDGRLELRTAPGAGTELCAAVRLYG
jgi:PAS domain S-box-containing protein